MAVPRKESLQHRLYLVPRLLSLVLGHVGEHGLEERRENDARDRRVSLCEDLAKGRE
jgi:hypothetical protein